MSYLCRFLIQSLLQLAIAVALALRVVPSCLMAAPRRGMAAASVPVLLLASSQEEHRIRSPHRTLLISN